MIVGVYIFLIVVSGNEFCTLEFLNFYVVPLSF